MGQECGKQCKEEFTVDKWQFNHQNPDDFTVCFWQKEPGVPVFWVAYRATLLGVLALPFTCTIFWPQEKVVWYKNLLYYAYWANIVEIVTFALALFITVKKFKLLKEYPNLSPLEEMPLPYKMTWFFYNISAPCSFIVSLFFWGIMYNPEKHTLLGLAIINNALNSFCIAVDFCLNSFPYRLLHFYVTFVYAVIYVLFTIIYQLNGGTGNKGEIPILSILDWRKPSEALMTCTIHSVCSCIMHCGLWGLYKLKCWIKFFITDRRKKKAEESGRQNDAELKLAVLEDGPWKISTNSASQL